MTKLVPTFCRKCGDPVMPFLRKVFFSDPYPQSGEDAIGSLPEGSEMIAAHVLYKPIMDRHGNVFDQDPDPIVDHAIVWDGKSYGNNGYCGPCHVAGEAEEGPHREAVSRDTIKESHAAEGRRLWSGLSVIVRLALLIINRDVRKWYANQAKAGEIPPWWAHEAKHESKSTR